MACDHDDCACMVVVVLFWPWVLLFEHVHTVVAKSVELSVSQDKIFHEFQVSNCLRKPLPHLHVSVPRNPHARSGTKHYSTPMKL